MTELITTLSTAIAAFVATNIDDIFILTILFSQVNPLFRRRHIVVGQYLGFSLLIMASIAGILGTYFVSSEWIRLLGLLPIILGLGSLANKDSTDNPDQTEEILPINLLSNEKKSAPKLLSAQTYGVAAITIANGSDNIGVYLPLFANTEILRLPIIVIVFLVLVGVWCLVAYQLTQLPTIAPLIRRYGSAFMPCVLIGLGVFIVKENWLLTILAFAISYIWLILYKQPLSTHTHPPENDQQ